MSKNIIYIILFFNLLFYMAANDVQMECSASYSKDSLMIDIFIKNHSGEDICIQNEYWEIGGNEKDNYLMAYPGNGYIVNSIYFYPSDSLGIKYRTERVDYPLLDIMPNTIIIKDSSELVFTITISEKFEKPEKVGIVIRLPYYYPAQSLL